MTELSEQERRKRRRAGCAWGCGGAFALVALAVAGVGAYWSYANQVPAVTYPIVALPNPNAREECLAAVALMPPDAGQALTDLQEGKEVDLRPLVRAAQPALTKIRGSFRHPYLNPPLTSASATFPELAPYRNIARLFALEGRLAEREGRYDDAVRSYLDCYRFGSEIQRGGVLIHGLVGNAIQAIALAPLDELSLKMEGDLATRTARRLIELEKRAPRAAECIEGEAQFGEMAALELMNQSRGSYQSLQQIMMGPNTGGAAPEWDWQSIEWGVRYGFTPKKKMLESYRRYMQQQIALAQQPYGRRGPKPERPDDPLNSLLLPIMDSATFSWDRGRANCRLVQGKLVARAFTMRHGRMPKLMAEAVPEIVPQEPLDWFGGKPLRIGPLEGKGAPIVYSLGPDMDDDKARALGQQVQQSSDGDLVEVRRRRLISPKGARTPGPGKRP